MVVLNVEPVLNRIESCVQGYRVKLRLTPEEFHKLMGLSWLKETEKVAAGEEAAERK